MDDALYICKNTVQDVADVPPPTHALRYYPRDASKSTSSSVVVVSMITTTTNAMGRALILHRSAVYGDYADNNKRRTLSRG